MKAYKGFDKDLKCRGEQFEIGHIYLKNVGELKLCTKTGWHFCDKLEDVFVWYSNDGNNRFCEIEVLGDVIYDKNIAGKKGITNSFKIIKEIPNSELAKLRRTKFIESFPLDFMNELQKKHHVIFGGSFALSLYGCNIKRDCYASDMDIIMPHYIKITKNQFENYLKQVQDNGNFSSGCDFDGNILVTLNDNKKIKIDYRIDPKQRYNIIKYKNYEFKVNPLEEIIAAKIRYNTVKHIKDLYTMLGVTNNWQ